MFKVVGIDGNEYGPISAEQVRAWIAQGRLNGQSRVLVPGAPDWQTISQLPEFAAALVGATAGAGTGAGAGAPPSIGPLPAADRAQTMAREILARDYQLEIGRCISRGWQLVMSRFWLSVGTALLMLIMESTLGAIPFFTYVIIGGYDWMFLKMARGEKAEVGDAFAGFSQAFLPLLLFSLVGQVLVTLGLAICVLPGIYLAVCWMIFTPLLILDHKLDFWAAMELSRKVVTRHWWLAFGLIILCGLIVFAGTLACGVGLLLAAPVMRASIVCAYEEIFAAVKK